MSKSFLKFKRKVRVQSILSAVLLGLGTGITAFAVITAVMKLLDREVTPLYYGICIGGAFIVATVLYFLFMSRELLRRRSFWMTVAAACVIICLLFSLILKFPAPKFTLPQ